MQIQRNELNFKGQNIYIGISNSERKKIRYIGWLPSRIVCPVPCGNPVTGKRKITTPENDSFFCKSKVAQALKKCLELHYL